MAEAVLDASAVLGVLWREPGFEEVADALSRSLISVINEAEIIGVLMQRGETAERALSIVHALPYEVVGLDRQLAIRAGALWRSFKPRGLSLGDRCCLALAERTALPALTSDQRWADLGIGVEVRLFRSGKER